MLNQRFGRFTVISAAEKERYFLCRCDCGCEKEVRKDHLLSGRTLSCGCLAKERARQRAFNGVLHKNMDGHSKRPEYSVWLGMRQRCNSPNNPAFKYYGGRGIGICERWASFDNFYADMGPRPSDRHTIERLDNDGNYEPGNCQWRLRKAQQRNQRITRWVTIDGTKYRASDLAEQCDHKTDTIIDRAERGLSLEEVLSPKRYYNLTGLSLGVAASAKKRSAKTHCKHGHEFTPENTHHNGRQRICRTCHRLREQARRAQI